MDRRHKPSPLDALPLKVPAELARQADQRVEAILKPSSPTSPGEPVTDIPLTDARRRALEWLAADGSWRSKPGRLVSALQSLSLGIPGTVSMRQGKLGARGGWEQQWRLTENGQRLRASVFSEPT